MEEERLGEGSFFFRKREEIRESPFFQIDMVMECYVHGKFWKWIMERSESQGKSILRFSLSGRHSRKVKKQ